MIPRLVDASSCLKRVCNQTPRRVPRDLLIRSHVTYHDAGLASRAAAETSPVQITPCIGPGSKTADAHFEVPHRFKLGLHPIREKEWLVRDHNVEQDLASKAELVSTDTTRGHVLGALPGSENAQEELFTMISGNLSEHHGCPQERSADWKASSEESPSVTDFIEAAGLRVQEDLAIMERKGESWVFTAGCVCFPSRWSFLSKIGRPMREIHEPVPGLNERIGPHIEKFFDKIKPNKLVLRMNSTIIDSPILFQPGAANKMLATDESNSKAAKSRAAAEAITVDNAGEHLLLRMERQTLRRLPASGAIAFTIHTYQMRLPDIAADEKLSLTVEQHYRSLLSTGMEGYKSHIIPFCDWLANARSIKMPMVQS